METVGRSQRAGLVAASAPFSASFPQDLSDGASCPERAEGGAGGGQSFITCVRSKRVSGQLGLTFFKLEFKGIPGDPQFQLWRKCGKLSSVGDSGSGSLGFPE